MNRRSFIFAILAAPLAWAGAKLGLRKPEPEIHGNRIVVDGLDNLVGFDGRETYTLHGPGSFWVDEGDGPEWFTLKDGETRVYRYGGPCTYTLESKE